MAVESALTVPIASSTRITRTGSRRRAPLALAAGLVGAVVVGWLLWGSTRETGSPAGTLDAPAQPTSTTAPAIALPADISEIESLLTQADAYFDRGTRPDSLGRHLDYPEDNSALGLYRQALALEPGNARAAAGIARIAGFYQDNAGKLCDRSLWEACATTARKGLAAAPDNADLQALLARAERGQSGG